MFNSLNFKMASNHPEAMEEPISQTRLDMTRGSLHDILDGNEVNVSNVLPLVPTDASDFTVNINQTLGEVIPNRDLGVLSSLKITDADIIIRNLQAQLNSAIEKNNTSTALLQRMDNRQKQLEVHLTKQKAEMDRLRAEKDLAVKEKQDYTVNQQKLEENIWQNLEKEYADKEKEHLKQLKDEMTAKVEAKPRLSVNNITPSSAWNCKDLKRNGHKSVK